MAASSFKAKRRLDYKKPDFTATDIDLTFHLSDECTQVSSTAHYVRLTTDHKAPLRLDGEDLDLKDVLLNGQSCKYSVVGNELIVPEVPDEFELTTKCEISPAQNTSLMGLYKSDGCFCTQCEPEGFRRITYFLDRPDVLAKYRVTIYGPEYGCGVLLSNGNLIESGEKNGHLYTVWEDPFPKPSYLFALVAGTFDIIEDTFITKSGREVKLGLYVDRGAYERGLWAMQSIKESMAWDERRFNLEYDLDNFKVVAVDFFNFGAMENKSLNIFNSSCVLVNPETATDSNYYHVQGVIGHEYFHNWTGDRVTLRDWFQLSLKESLTVFRDQEFSSDVNSRVLTRLEAINVIRSAQFAEDAGPMAHPVRPEQVMEMNNFYTVTIYDKGAEIIRMIHTILGEENFQKGVAYYLDRYDGSAATIEDFVLAMETASLTDLSQFRRWYSQAGTPEVYAKWTWLSPEKVKELALTQSLAAAKDKAQQEAQAQAAAEAQQQTQAQEAKEATLAEAAAANDVAATTKLASVVDSAAPSEVQKVVAAAQGTNPAVVGSDSAVPEAADAAGAGAATGSDAADAASAAAVAAEAAPEVPEVVLTPEQEQAAEAEATEKAKAVGRGKLVLTLTQSTPPTPNQKTKEPFVIPVRTSFLEANGAQVVPVELPANGVLLFTQAEQRFEFTDVPEGTLPVVLRDFSAPVKLKSIYTTADYINMLEHCDDTFIKVDAQMSLISGYIHQHIDKAASGALPAPDDIIKAMGYVLQDETLDYNLKAMLITIPGMRSLMETFNKINLDGLFTVRESVETAVAQALQDSYLELERKTRSKGHYKYDPQSAAQRAVHNACLQMLARAYVANGEVMKADDLATRLFEETDNMTERLAALSLAVNEDLTCKAKLLEDFESRYGEDPLTFDKFFSVQAAVPSEDTVNVVRKLLDHPRFDLTNPNRVRALVGTFGYGNPVALHRSDGMGYLLILDVVKRLNTINPSMAARILDGMINFKRFDQGRQQQARAYLEKIKALPNLSRSVFEKVNAALGDDAAAK